MQFGYIPGRCTTGAIFAVLSKVDDFVTFQKVEVFAKNSTFQKVKVVLKISTFQKLESRSEKNLLE